MEFRSWKGFCLCDLGGGFPPEAVPAQPFAPLVLTVRRDAMRSRGCFAVQTAGEALEPEGVCALLPSKTVAPPELDALVRRFGDATVLNTAFVHAFDFLGREKNDRPACGSGRPRGRGRYAPDGAEAARTRVF